ncbi:hypothetical protein [Elizabethkingia anophelis]|uniref:hypothetical protein n=1 Tax=Elizabethkingia anophelis TaxID=1117645 RepID=UPI00259BA78E|nr:hypothetical protein [Elizabethkingia anophelis]WJJ99421.1 hypothetical protein QTN78_15080 [Elizabethkingia anophelis]
MIFEIRDSKGDYAYLLIKNINLPNTFDTSDFLETHFGKKPVPVTLKQYHKVKLDYYNDPVADMMTLLKGGGTVIIESLNVAMATGIILGQIFGAK